MTYLHLGGSSNLDVFYYYLVVAVAALALSPSVLPTFLLGVALVFTDKPFLLSGVLTSSLCR